MFDGLMKSKFFSKCKSDVKLIRTRIEIIKKKRAATQKYLRNDIVDLLRNGLDIDAFGRAEGLLAEMVKSQCYELIDQYCEHISKNLSAMNKERECPEECREAVSSLMFAAARFADLPELRELRTLFSERYGKSLDYYVSKQFSEKLSSDPPSNNMKLELLQEIAAESGLDWDPKALENKLLYDKKQVKESNGSNHLKGSDQKASRGYEFSKAREITPERKQELPFHERNEDRLPSKRDEASPPVKIKDKVGSDEPLKQRLIPPPYTKPEVNKANTSSTEDSDSCNDEKEASAEDDAVVGAKPMGKSVRTRHGKPPSGQEIGEINKENVAQGRRILRFFDGGRNQRDEEERIMDRLLRHYSRKKGTSKSSKAEAENGAMKNSMRTSSVRVEPTSPADIQKKHARAASFQPDLLNGKAHVHPKLPDYDEFVARLAAFKGK